jgi:hypothetical protein
MDNIICFNNMVNHSYWHAVLLYSENFSLETLKLDRNYKPKSFIFFFDIDMDMKVKASVI